MKLAGVCVILFALSYAALCQPYTSTPQGTFTVSQVKGCAPFTITVDAPSCDGSVGCDIAYTGDFADPQNTKTFLSTDTHTYTQPGIYTLKLVRGVQLDNITIEVVANTQPDFQLASCGGNRVSLSVLENTYDEYVVDYGDGTGTFTVGPMASNQHTYTSGGTKSVTVRGRNNGALDNCNSVSQTINAATTLPTPTISLVEVLDNSSVRIEFDGLPNIQYKLEVAVNNNPTFQQIKTLFNTTVDTIRNIKPDDNYYCFRIGAFDPCLNATAYSQVICSANFDLAVVNNENQLTWTPAPGPTITNQELEIIPTNSGTSLSIQNVSSLYADRNVSCGTEYCYQLTLHYTNNSQSISLLKCGTAISTDIPDAVKDISSIVGESGGVELIWQPIVGFTPDEFSVYRSSGSNLNLLSTTTEFTFTDDGYMVDSPSCYKISYTDVCGNKSPQGVETCPILLTGNLESNNDIQLSWTDYAGWSGGVSNYVIEKYDQDGTLLETIDAGQATSYTDASQNLDNQVYIYVVLAIAQDAGIPESVSNQIIIIKDPNLFYPTGFTPNGDGLNDIFNVFGQYITAFEMNIFNRWGELMYTTTDLEVGWDGNFKALAMPEGTYTFVATIKDFAGRTFEKSGSIVLLKKNK